MKTVAILGASGGFATAAAHEFLNRDWQVDAICRAVRANVVKDIFAQQLQSAHLKIYTVENRYTEFNFTRNYDAVVFTQALFDPAPLPTIADGRILDEVTVGLTDPMELTRLFLREFPSVSGMRRNICFIGSTSAYAGFKNSAVYCAVKHGLLGFVRALNEEYAMTDDRFWLFSMGSMSTTMGLKLTTQDSQTFLNVQDVARRVVSAVVEDSNIFEPEVLIRRRVIR